MAVARLQTTRAQRLANHKTTDVHKLIDQITAPRVYPDTQSVNHERSLSQDSHIRNTTYNMSCIYTRNVTV